MFFRVELTSKHRTLLLIYSKGHQARSHPLKNTNISSFHNSPIIFYNLGLWIWHLDQVQHNTIVYVNSYHLPISDFRKQVNIFSTFLHT